VPLFQNKAGIPEGAALFSSDLVTEGRAGVLFVAGTAYSREPDATIGMSVLVDDQPVGQIVTYSNEGLSHKAFVPGELVLKPSAGTHRFAIAPLGAPGAMRRTVVNQDDRVNAVWLELGDDAVVTAVVDRKRALPATGKLVTKGGPVLVLASGSGFRPGDSTTTGLGTQIKVGETILGRTLVHSREVLSHKAFVSSATLTELPAGEHQVVVSALANTAHDFNDYFSVTAIELPH